MIEMSWIAIEKLIPNGRNARTHSRKQVRQIADSITAFGFVVPTGLSFDEITSKRRMLPTAEHASVDVY